MGQEAIAFMEDVVGLDGRTASTPVKVSESKPVPTKTAASDAAVFLDYEAIAASETDEICGPTGAAGDWLSHIVITPAVAAAGAVSIKDGSGSAISIFAGGATTALPTLAPFTVHIGAVSTSGAWKVTTGANVTVLACGRFT